MARRQRTLTNDELATIAAFVVRERQERVRLLLARGEVNDSEWAHNPPLKESAMWQLPGDWSADDLLAELRRRGASGTATGIIGQVAGQTLPLNHAVRTVFAAWYGDLLSLVPGRLAYYDGEWKNARYVLVAETPISAPSPRLKPCPPFDYASAGALWLEAPAECRFSTGLSHKSIAAPVPKSATSTNAL